VGTLLRNQVGAVIGCAALRAGRRDRPPCIQTEWWGHFTYYLPRGSTKMMLYSLAGGEHPVVNSGRLRLGG